jgi:hypothetical protein
MWNICYCYQILTKFGICQQNLVKLRGIRFHNNPFCGSRDVIYGQTDKTNRRIFATLRSKYAENPNRGIIITQISWKRRVWRWQCFPWKGSSVPRSKGQYIRVYVCFVCWIIFLRNQSEKISGYIPKYAKIFAVNLYWCLEEKPWDVENLFSLENFIVSIISFTRVCCTKIIYVTCIHWRHALENVFYWALPICRSAPSHWCKWMVCGRGPRDSYSCHLNNYST